MSTPSGSFPFSFGLVRSIKRLVEDGARWMSEYCDIASDVKAEANARLKNR
jgi:hypothetical protein